MHFFFVVNVIKHGGRSDAGRDPGRVWSLFVTLLNFHWPVVGGLKPHLERGLSWRISEIITNRRMSFLTFITDFFPFVVCNDG